MRLLALYGKGKNLTEAEATEKNLLAQIAGEDEAKKILAEAEAGDEEEEPEGDDDAAGDPEGDDDEGEGDDDEAEPPANATIGQRIAAMVSSNKALAGKIAAANAREKQATAALAAMKTRAEAAEKTLKALTAKLGTSEELVAKLEAEALTADDAITQALSGLNIPRDKMPKKSSVSSAEATLEDLNTQISAETDPVKKGRLAQQAWDLVKAQGGVYGGAN